MAMAAVAKPNNTSSQKDLPVFLQRKIQFREAGSSTSTTSNISYKRTTSEKTEKKLVELQLEWPAITGIGPGLVNLGNTCFLNATLQCLWYTAPWTTYLRSSLHSRRCTRKEACVLCELETLTLQQGQPGKRALAPQGLVARMKQVARHFRPYAQQDAHEYLRFLQEALNKCLLHAGDGEDEADTVLGRIFRGELQSSITCGNCGHASGTVDPFLDLSLDVKKGVHSVTAALQAYEQPESLAGDTPYHCGKCRKASPGATKQLHLHTLPPVLTLHLKRFSSPYTKITRPITFSPELTVNRTTYCLYAVLVHQGQSCASGHYYSYVKAANGMWYEMDDSSVRQVSLNTVLAQPAYILFYQRKSMPAPAQVVMEDSESEVDVITPLYTTPPTKTEARTSNIANSSELDHFMLLKKSSSHKKPKQQKSPRVRKSPRISRNGKSSSSSKTQSGQWQIKSLK